MPDREKVIKGLEWCMNEKHDCYREKGCPYENEGEDIGCKYALHRDALALLKAQEPMVMVGAKLTDTELIEAIRKAPITLKPAVDAVPVVRCRDCKYGKLCFDADGHRLIQCTNTNYPAANVETWPLELDWYCAGGERRESE